jgi:hypothetical protein
MGAILIYFQGRVPGVDATLAATIRRMTKFGTSDLLSVGLPPGGARVGAVGVVMGRVPLSAPTCPAATAAAVIERAAAMTGSTGTASVMALVWRRWSPAVAPPADVAGRAVRDTTLGPAIAPAVGVADRTGTSHRVDRSAQRMAPSTSFGNGSFLEGGWSSGAALAAAALGRTTVIVVVAVALWPSSNAMNASSFMTGVAPRCGT